MSQHDLACKVYGELDGPDRIPDVSRIERGLRKNPHQKTVDRYVSALGISKEEIDRCRLDAEFQDEALKRSLDLPEELAIQLALQFDEANPGAGRAALREHLEDKERRFGEVIEQIRGIVATEGRLNNLRALAEDAEHFNRADELLAEAEDVQQAEQTLGHIRKQAEIREARAHVALTHGDPETAYRHFVAAASFFDPFDAEECILWKCRLAARLVEYAERNPGAAAELAVALAENGFTHAREGNPSGHLDFARTTLASALVLLSERASPKEQAAHLNRAASLAEAAVQSISHNGDPLAWALAASAHADALRGLGTRGTSTSSNAMLEQAGELYERSASILADGEKTRTLTSAINDRALVLHTLGRRCSGSEGVRHLCKAISLYHRALELAKDLKDLRMQITIQNNAANAELILRERQGPESLKTHYPSIEHVYHSILVDANITEFPVEWAMTQNNLGMAGFAVSRILGRVEALAQLDKSRRAFEAAREILVCETLPTDWVMVSNNFASTLKSMADHSPSPEKAGLLDEAIETYAVIENQTQHHDLKAYWATSNNNLAACLVARGRLGGEGRESDLVRAIEIYDEILDVRKKTEAPVEWAHTLNNRALAYQCLAAFRPKEAETLLLQAVADYESGLEVIGVDNLPFDWARMTNNHAIALRILSADKNGSTALDMLERAAAAHHGALRVFDQQTEPRSWIEIAREYAMTLEILADRSPKSAQLSRYRRALEAAERVRQVLDVEGSGIERAFAMNDAAILCLRVLAANEEAERAREIAGLCVTLCQGGQPLARGQPLLGHALKTRLAAAEIAAGINDGDRELVAQATSRLQELMEQFSAAAPRAMVDLVDEFRRAGLSFLEAA